ncbi:hypothetical protein FHETE_6205 [Fusarium heterosporum]|uniref:Uncharacterized protein n=1 Tax=Fusarium heterosporum TaxID=42747 RepID=A0A8H5WPT6_FUSHE|nr:hypothetical protein FHETE_6205 [Fusarium heterosporum]
MSDARNHWGLSCTSGGNFYICEDDDTQFMGCCLSDPCGKNKGKCPKGDLRATTFESDKYDKLPPQDCDNSQGPDNWYTCAFSSPPFLGCCSQNACGGDGCPRDRLVPAKLSKNENNRLNFLHPNDASSTTSSIASSTVSETTSATASSTSAVEASDGGGLGTGAVAGIAVGAAVGGIIIFALLAWLFWWKPRQNKKKQAGAGAGAAYHAAPAAPAMSEGPYSPMANSFQHQSTFNAQSPMSGYQQSFASTPTVPNAHYSGVSSMDQFQKFSPDMSQSDRPQSYAQFSDQSRSPGLPPYQQQFGQHQMHVVSEMDGSSTVAHEMSAEPESGSVQRNSSFGPEILNTESGVNKTAYK